MELSSEESRADSYVSDDKISFNTFKKVEHI